MRRRPAKLAAALLAAAVNTRGVHAASEDLEALAMGGIPTVVTASKKAEKSTEAPGTVHVITRAEIRARGYSNLKDVLRDVPGMETIEYSFSEWGTEVPVRGVVGNNKIAVLLNGVRVNPPGGENFPFRADFSVRNAEQIEVVYGPGSTLYGQDAISALINVITVSPKADGGEAEFGAAASPGGGLGWATGLHKSGGLDLSAHAQYQRAELSDLSSTFSDHYRSIFTPAPAGVDPEPHRWDNGLNGFVRLAGRDTSVQVWYRESSRSSSEGGYSGILEYVRQALWEDSSLVASIENTHALSPSLDLTSTLVHNKYEIDPRTRYVFPNGSGGLFLNDYKYGVGLGTTLEEKLTLTLDKATLVGGVELGHYDIKPKSTYPNGADRSLAFTDQAGTFDYFVSTNPLSAVTSVPRANDLAYSNVGAYLEGTLTPVDRLKLILGGRVDKNSRFSQVPFSPRAAAVYRVTEAATAKYVFSKAFLYPAPYFGFNNFDNGAALNIANPKLEPEKATSHEVNLSWNTEKLDAGASLYMNEQKNLIIVGDRATAANVIQQTVFLDAGGTQTRVLTHSANAGASKAKGVDLTAKLKSGRSSLWASYSYVDFEADILGVKSTLDQISRANVRLGGTAALGSRLMVTPSLVYRTTPVNLAVPAGLKGKTADPYELNLHAVYTPAKNLDVFLDLRNVTNHRYALRGVLSPTLQEPFTASAGVRLSL